MTFSASSSCDHPFFFLNSISLSAKIIFLPPILHDQRPCAFDGLKVPFLACLIYQVCPSICQPVVAFGQIRLYLLHFTLFFLYVNSFKNEVHQHMDIKLAISCLTQFFANKVFSYNRFFCYVVGIITKTSV